MFWPGKLTSLLSWWVCWPLIVAMEASPLNLKFIEQKKEVKEGLITIAEVGSNAEIGHIVETDSKDYLSEVDLNLDKISEKKTSGMETSKEEIISEEVTEKVSGATADLTEIEVGQVTDNFQEILEEMTKVVVGQNQDQG